MEQTSHTDLKRLVLAEAQAAGFAAARVAAPAAIGPDAAARLGVVDGDRVTVDGATGSITLPVRVTAMPDRVVWLPMRAPGSEIRSDLGTAPGGVVRLSAGGAL